MTLKHLPRLAPLTAAIALVFSIPGSASAASTSIDVTDRKGDGSPSLDIRHVKVTNRADYIEVQLTVTKLVTNPAKKDTSAAWVHFDTGGTARPNHAMALLGYHGYSGGVSDWFRLSPNEYGDPFGDWTDCGVDGGYDWISTWAKKNRITFRAPKECLNYPDRVRVEVNTEKQSKSRLKNDWLGSVKTYTAWVDASSPEPVE
ncbi:MULTISPECIES: hypothetical protein [unclassified Aeromicrobium]|uniref:hypothetical protein n=1 Tax=unclassified Aeromicrobium TaxID=2633570 RepID=UPI00288C37AF|nr:MULTISPECIES: hypothetical protein [unclassified Aeromicrobium]